MKFKVGDKVRVKDDADLEKVGIREDIKGLTAKVISVDEYCVISPLYLLDDEDWWLNEESLEIVAEEEPLQVLFSPQQVRSAAEFLSLNNNFLNKTVDVDGFEQMILDYIKSHAVKEDCTFVGTAGFCIKFGDIGDGTIAVDVLVSPDISQYSEYVIGQLKDGKLVVEY